MDKALETDDASLILPFRAVGAVFQAAAHAHRAFTAYLNEDRKDRAEHMTKAIHQILQAFDFIVGQDLEEDGYMFALGVDCKGADALEEIGGRLSALDWCKVEIKDESFYLWSAETDFDEGIEEEETQEQEQ